jgi:hypothetical protein
MTDKEFLDKLRSLHAAFEELSKFPQFKRLSSFALDQDEDFSLVDSWDGVIIALQLAGGYEDENT